MSKDETTAVQIFPQCSEGSCDAPGYARKHTKLLMGNTPRMQKVIG